MQRSVMFLEDVLLPVIVERLLQLVLKSCRIVFAMKGVKGERQNHDEGGSLPTARPQVEALQGVKD